jgi:hypothetical protein
MPTAPNFAVGLQSTLLPTVCGYDDVGPNERKGRTMIRSDTDGILSDALIPLEGADPGSRTIERLIRWTLTVGFLFVLTLEAWLLWRAWESVF